MKRRREIQDRLRVAQPGRRHTGFTLIEILVVVAIILVLIGILLPSLSAAREQSRKVVCLSNMRQLATASVAYAMDTGYIVPAGYRDTGEEWMQILARTHFLKLETTDNSSAGVMVGGPLFCPSGNMDLQWQWPANMPTDGDDPRGQSPLRIQSSFLPNKVSMVDCWYGINGSTQHMTNGVAGTVELPCRRIPVDLRDFDTELARYPQVRKPAELVFIFDGIFMNHASINPFRINGRHDNKRTTNIAFFDGHAESFERKSLPQTVNDFTLANLKAKYPQPRWRLDQ